VFDCQAFEEWLRKGPERNPSLYGGRVVHPSTDPGNAPQVAKNVKLEPLGKQMMEERVEFDRKQATSDHDDDPFDAIEVWEDDDEKDNKAENQRA